MDESRHQLGAAGAERVAERDRAAVDVELLRVGPGMLEPCQRHARKGLVDFVEVDVGHGHPGALERTVGGEQRLFEHDHRIAGGDGEVVDARQRGEAVRLERRFAHHQHRRGTVADLARRSRGDRAIGREQLDARDAFQRRIETDAFIDGVQLGAFGGLDFHRHDLALEGAGLGRGNRAFVAGEREAIEIVLGEAVLLDDHLGAHELAELDAGILGLQLGRHVVAEAFLHVEGGVRAHRHAAHAFHAAGDHHILHAAHDGLRGELDRLLAGTALTVDGDGGGGLRQVLCGQHAHAADLHRLLARLRDAAGDDVVDRLGIDA